MARELTKIGPFRMIDNIYFVGTKEASSHLIDTGEGLILIDTGYEETADIVLESMGELGFDPRVEEASIKNALWAFCFVLILYCWFKTLEYNVVAVFYNF